MLALFSLLWFVVLVFFLIGLINPKWISFLKLPAKRKSVLLFLGLPCLLIMILIGTYVPDNIKSISKESKPRPAIENTKIEQKNEVVAKELETPLIKDKIIPGIMPADVYLNFEKIGFTTTKKIGTEGSFFYSDNSKDGIEYHVTTYCEKNVKDVTTIRLTAIRIEPQYNEVGDLKPFLNYGGGVPYEGTDVEKIKVFIDKNYYKDKASIVISGVRFTIYAPTKFARELQIEKE